MTRAPPGAQAPGELFAPPAGDATGPSCRVLPERDVRVHRQTRSQRTWGRVDRDAALAAVHPARAIMAVLDELYLRGLYAEVRARFEAAGAAAIDPKLLLGLWVYVARDAVAALRLRMATDEAICKQRATTAEIVNADGKAHRGLGAAVRRSRANRAHALRTVPT